MLVAFALQEDTGSPPATRRVPYTIASVRRHMPAARIVQLTKLGFPAVDGIDAVLRHPMTGDFIVWAYNALSRLCDRGEDVLQIATDVLLQADVSPMFKDESFDVAACRYPKQVLGDGSFCGDVNFIRPGGGRLFREALEIYLNLPRTDGWLDGQKVFLVATKLTTLRVKELDYRIYCRTPEHPNQDMSDASIVHFRGARKGWMIPYAERTGLSPILQGRANQPQGLS